jgi:hypothetical protein
MNIGKLSDLPKGLYGEVSDDGKQVKIRDSATVPTIHTMDMGTLKNTRSNFTYNDCMYCAIVDFTPGVGADSEVTLRIYEVVVNGDNAVPVDLTSAHLQLEFREPGKEPVKDFLSVEEPPVPVPASDPVPLEASVPTEQAAAVGMAPPIPKTALDKEFLTAISEHVTLDQAKFLLDRWKDNTLFQDLHNHMLEQSVDPKMVELVAEVIQEYIGTDNKSVNTEGLAKHLLIGNLNARLKELRHHAPVA